MTEMQNISGAPKTQCSAWDAINWQKAEHEVNRLQMRIAKAYRNGQYNKVKTLQWLLTHSFYAKALAVKRVSSNKGAKTPGIDGVVWRTPHQKMQATLSLKRKGYRTQPLRRIYIPKKQPGKKRPLSIPAMRCRAQQALHLLALEPIAELMADKNSYGFRPLRSAADALGQCFITLSRKTSAKYILEGDIKSCFDMISHEWLLENTPMDKKMLAKWLAAGYIEEGKISTTELGTPQGGIISPTLLIITLSGLENTVKNATKREDCVNVISYADDFIITGKTKEVLESVVGPVVTQFLEERGLQLSEDKTHITHIQEGFDFLGVNSRKYRNGKLIQKPAKGNVKQFLKMIRKLIKENQAAKTENLIYQLNLKLKGWANYFRYYCSKMTFGYIQSQVFSSLWKWAAKRHPRKGKRWIARKYFRTKHHSRWKFYATIKDKQGNPCYLDCINISHTPIRRHVKIKADATPFDPAYRDYIQQRQLRCQQKRLWNPCKEQWSPWWEIQPF